MDQFTIDDDAVPPWDVSQEERRRTATKLLEVLRNGQADDSARIAAAKELGGLQCMDDEIADTLLDIARANDQPEQLRKELIELLVPEFIYIAATTCDKPEDHPFSGAMLTRIQSTLREIHFDKAAPVALRRNALRTAVYLPQEWQRQAIQEAYSRSEGTWKELAMFCMRFHPGFEEAIIEALDSPNREVRYQAIYAAGDTSVKAAWSHIVALIASKETSRRDRVAAIDAVSSIFPEKAREVLGELLNSKDADISEAAWDEVFLADALLEAEPPEADPDEEGEEESGMTISWTH